MYSTFLQYFTVFCSLNADDFRLKHNCGTFCLLLFLLWASSWGTTRGRGPPWHSSSGGSTGTTRQSILLPAWKNGRRHNGSQGLEHPPYLLDLGLADFFRLGEWRRPWHASRWTRRVSRMPGKGLPGPSSPTTMPQPSCGGLRRPKSVCGSTAPLSINLEK